MKNLLKRIRDAVGTYDSEEPEFIEDVINACLILERLKKERDQARDSAKQWRDNWNTARDLDDSYNKLPWEE